MDAKRAVLRVGDGRGFVVRSRGLYHDDKVVITAAHCLPRKLPPPHPARHDEEETYRRLLGPLGGKRTVWARCLFVDPIADVAVLGQPDNQTFSDEADAYDALVEKAQGALAVADAPKEGFELVTLRSGDYQIKKPVPGKGPARVLSLEGRWLDGNVSRRGGWLSFEPESHFVGGMSGSPIIDATTGAAIGVVSVTQMSPVILDSVSARLARSLSVRRRKKFITRARDP